MPIPIEAGRQLGQVRPVGATDTTLYAPIARVIGRVTSIVIVNTSGAAALARIAHHDSGTNLTQAEALMWDFDITTAPGVGMGEPYILTFDGGMFVRNPGTIRVRSSVADAHTFTAYGSELVIP